ncbi:hypothetical protein CEXT_473491 [Caerostris extrusa]|uniref:Uncharacterized protein n=1 Tax=Caerostris extrusa TaxID=172846 RepID=A0AAV4V4C7_CAEEX|nr:hypothetical protein CEXT_473491 [Caerostris extrusa]
MDLESANQLEDAPPPQPPPPSYYPWKATPTFVNRRRPSIIFPVATKRVFSFRTFEFGRRIFEHSKRVEFLPSILWEIDCGLSVSPASRMKK